MSGACNKDFWAERRAVLSRRIGLIAVVLTLCAACSSQVELTLDTDGGGAPGGVNDATNTFPDGSSDGADGAGSDAVPGDGQDTKSSDASDSSIGCECSCNGELDPCHVWACESCTCVDTVLADGSTCDDGNACTSSDKCESGKKCIGTPKLCDPSKDLCLLAICDPASGQCSTKADAQTEGKPCTDGDACTDGELCTAGKCDGGGPVVCNDNNPCTADTCDAKAGCVFMPTGVTTTTCDDYDPCTANDHCLTNGKCKGPSVLDALPVVPCQIDQCDAKTGQVSSKQASLGTYCQTEVGTAVCSTTPIPGICNASGQCVVSQAPPQYTCSGCSGICLNCGVGGQTCVPLPVPP